MSIFKKTIRSVRIVGFKDTLITIKYRLRKQPADVYKVWMRHNDPSAKELKRQERTVFAFSPEISIVVTVKDVDPLFFLELVNSVINQTYVKWELCVADGSHKQNSEISELCHKDERIKYVYTGKPAVSHNTNEALNLASGDYIAFIGQNDLLPRNCLFEVAKAINEDPSVEFIYTDEDRFKTADKSRFDPHFKPDFGIDTLRSGNYIGNLSMFRRDILKKLGGEKSEYAGAENYDLLLRMAEMCKNIHHIPKILYHGREKVVTDFETGKKALEDHLKREGLYAVINPAAVADGYEVIYRVSGTPKVTILIPNCNQKNTLSVCVNSILQLTTYKNYEIVIIENNSTDKDIFAYYDDIQKDSRVRVLKYPKSGFNYSKIINYGVKNTDGEFIVQLNNDTELLTPDWLEKAVGMCQREDVGCVGVKLYYPDYTVQHAGVILGIGGVASHLFKGLSKDTHGYLERDSRIQNMSIVTAACMMSKRSVYEEVGYMEEKLAVAFNDVDFCMKVIKSGKSVVYNPYIEFIHYESKSRGFDDTPEKTKRFNSEIRFFIKKWKNELKKGDPYYNKNLRLDSDQCEIREEKVL